MFALFSYALVFFTFSFRIVILLVIKAKQILCSAKHAENAEMLQIRTLHNGERDETYFVRERKKIFSQCLFFDSLKNIFLKQTFKNWPYETLTLQICA